MADLLKRLKISEQQYGVGMEDNPFQDTSPDECMNVCFGGSGGGSPPPPPPQTVTQQTSNIPAYFQPYLERLFERAEGVTTEPFQRYEGQRLAEVTPQQKAAYQGVEDLVGGFKPYIATADVLTSQAAQQSTDPMAVASRMNPYQQSVIDIQKREALRDAEKLQQQIGASAVGAGAFGGSRQALQETELARQTGQRLADIQAVGSQQAYQQALNQLAADRAASLAAGQQFAGLGTTQQQLGLAGLGALETVGQTKQAQQQRPLDIAYEDFARETTFPSQQVQQMSSVLRGFNLPTSTYATTQTQQSQPGFGQQLLGYGSGALGLYGAGKTFGLFAGGGDVNPGLKALAKEAPEAVENMGYDPDEVANAYVGGRMNFQGQGPSFVPSPFSPMAGGSGYFSTPQPSPKSNLTNISTPSAGSSILGTTVPQTELDALAKNRGNFSSLYSLQSLQDIRDLRERIKDLDKEGEGDTDKVREILEGVQKAKQEKLDKDKEKKGYEALMEGIPIGAKILGADPSQNLGAIAFGALSESMPRIQELAGEINDLPIAEQELALETELAKLELSDKDRARAKQQIQLEIAGMAEETKLLKEMASMANIDLDSFYTYSEAEKFIDKQVGSATGKQYTSLQNQTPRLINKAALNTIQWGQQTGTKSANRLKLYFQGQLANLLVQSGYSTKKPDNSLFTNQNTQTGGTGISATGGSFYSNKPQMNPSGGKGQTPGQP
jgi:hypothetical protein